MINCFFDIQDEKTVEGLFISKEKTFPAVNPNEVGMPITQTLGVGRDIDEGRTNCR